jgi:hypothetical protein
MVLLPAILLLLAFRIIPSSGACFLSFTNFDGLGGADWVGAANYRSVLADPVFRDSLVNTLLVLATLPVWIMLPMLLADPDPPGGARRATVPRGLLSARRAVLGHRRLDLQRRAAVRRQPQRSHEGCRV